MLSLLLFAMMPLSRRRRDITDDAAADALDATLMRHIRRWRAAPPSGHNITLRCYIHIH